MLDASHACHLRTCARSGSDSTGVARARCPIVQAGAPSMDECARASLPRRVWGGARRRAGGRKEAGPCARIFSRDGREAGKTRSRAGASAVTAAQRRARESDSEQHARKCCRAAAATKQRQRRRCLLPSPILLFHPPQVDQDGRGFQQEHQPHEGSCSSTADYGARRIALGGSSLSAPGGGGRGELESMDESVAATFQRWRGEM